MRAKSTIYHMVMITTVDDYDERTKLAKEFKRESRELRRSIEKAVGPCREYTFITVFESLDEA